MNKIQWWQEPEIGDIVWCHFPDELFSPNIKPRPALVLQVLEDEENHFYVKVIYGTSQKTKQLYSGEFAIYKEQHKVAYDYAGLSYDTKFNLKKIVKLPYNSVWFSIQNTSKYNSPRIGLLHISMHKTLQWHIKLQNS